MESFFRATIAGAVVAAIATAAFAADAGYPRMTGGADDCAIEYGAGRINNAVGGGRATLTGFGDEQVLRHADAGHAVRTPDRRIAAASGDAGGVVWIEEAGSPPRPAMLASR